MTDYILLKWGSLKGWDFSNNPKAWAIFEKYEAAGMSASAMAQRDTPEQKQLLCEMIDAFDGKISNDWDGEIYTKERAKQYIMEYGK